VPPRARRAPLPGARLRCACRKRAQLRKALAQGGQLRAALRVGRAELREQPAGRGRRPSGSQRRRAEAEAVPRPLPRPGRLQAFRHMSCALPGGPAAAR
jgi:hypothetical protein